MSGAFSTSFCLDPWCSKHLLSHLYMSEWLQHLRPGEKGSEGGKERDRERQKGERKKCGCNVNYSERDCCISNAPITQKLCSRRLPTIPCIRTGFLRKKKSLTVGTLSSQWTSLLEISSIIKRWCFRSHTVSKSASVTVTNAQALIANTSLRRPDLTLGGPVVNRAGGLQLWNCVSAFRML